MTRWWTIAVIVPLLNSAYLVAWPSPTIFYMANAVLHLGLGLVVAAAAVRKARLWPVLLVAALLGLFLALAGTTTRLRWALVLHVAVGAGFVLVLGRRIAAPALALLLAAFVLRAMRPAGRIHNPTAVPASMEEEAHGAGSPFFP